MSRPFQPVHTIRGDITLSDRVVRELEDRIISGELVAGERLPTESELCDLLGVSRSVVRDAMRTLAAHGLIEVRQGRGMIITTPDDDAYSAALTLLLARSDLRMSDVLQARTMLETHLGLVAVDSSEDEDVEALERHLRELCTAIESRDWMGASDSHVGFHTALVHALHLPALDLLLEPMQQLIVSSAAPPLEADDVWDAPAHEPIIEALRRRDSAAMQRALAQHYRRSRESATREWLELPFREAAAISRKRLEQRSM